MPDVTIRKGVWDNFVLVAEKQHKKPETLAQQVLQEYIQRVSDEELLERSASAARRAPFRTDETEAVIRKYRERKHA